MSVQKQALGRVAHLDHLYDERSESFLDSTSLFNCGINPSALKKTAIPFTEISYLVSASTSEKLQKLSVDAQLKLSVICGLVALDGSAKYLSQKEESSDKSCRTDLFYKMTTVKEEVDIARLSPDEINKESLQAQATHLVVGIKWGANVIGSFDYETEDGETKQNIEGKLFFIKYI